MGLVRLLIAVAALVTLLSFAPSALAAPHHVFTSSFGASGTGASQFGASSPNGAALSQATGDLYVADTANSRIERFTSTGSFVSAFGWGVDDGTAAAQVCTSGCEAGISGAGAGQLATPAFVAVDNSAGPSAGDVYVADTTNNTVVKFSAAGAYISTIDGSTATDGPFGGLAGIAVNASGELWVYDGNANMFRFAQDGTFTTDFNTGFGVSPVGIAVDASDDLYIVRGNPLVEKIDDTGADLGQVTADNGTTGLAVDPVTGELYVNEGTTVERFAASCDPSGGICAIAETFGSPDLTAGSGLAVRGTDSRAYVADPGATQVAVFDLGDPPIATTQAVTTVHHTSAVLNGHLDPGNDPAVTDCHFDYGTTTAYGSTLPCDQPAPFAAPADVTATLGGLTPGDSYHYRLVITTTSNGVVDGADNSVAPSPFPLTQTAFGPDGTPATTFSNPEALEVDQSSGDVYVVDSAAGKLYKFDANGVPADFSALGTNVIDGLAFDSPSAAQVAVDNSGGPADGDIYVALRFSVRIYRPDGTQIGQLTQANGANYQEACGVDVDPSGKVYVGDFNGFVDRYVPAANPATNADYDSQVIASPTCDVAADSTGAVYASHWPDGPLTKFAASDFGTSNPGTVIDTESHAVSVDPTNDDVYVAHLDKVVRYSAAGTQLETFGSPEQVDSHGVAVKGLGGKRYVSDTATAQVRIYDPSLPLKVPTLTQEDPTAVTGTSATLNAKVDPETFAVTDCHFDYGPSTSYGQSAPCAPAPGSGSGDVAVSADLTGLIPGGTYHFRLVATNAFGTAKTSDQAVDTRGPRVSGTSASEITSQEAKLSAQVNPVGKATTFHFDYGTTASYGQSTAESRSIGTESVDHPAIRTIGGLLPATTYHFRVVATNADVATTGPDTTFTTFASAPTFSACGNDRFRAGASSRLPDCRAYEQASTTNHGGNDIQGDRNMVQASASGDAVTFFALGGLSGSHGTQDFPIFMARRGQDSWSTSGLFPPPSYGSFGNFMGWTPDLVHTYTSMQSSASGLPTTFVDRDSSDGSIDTIISSQPGGNGAFDAASADGSKVFFENQGPGLTPGAAPDVNNLYVWDRGSKTIALAGVLPATEGGAAPAQGSFPGPYQDAPNGPDLGHGGQAVFDIQNRHAISDDGERAFFTAGGTGQIYLRSDAAGPHPSTDRVSASLDGTSDPHGSRPAAFMAASRDGSIALFTSCERLTADSTAVSNGDFDCTTADQGRELYAYYTDVSGHHELKDLTVNPASTAPRGADVMGILGASDDASYVYFVANGVLAPGASPGDCHSDLIRFPKDPWKGECNLYLSHDGDITYISRLTAASPGSDGTLLSDSNDWQDTLEQKGYDSGLKARVSPDGKTVLFRSRLPLSGYDSSGPRCEGGRFGISLGAGTCAEYFRYRVGDSGPLCVTCNPTGARPDGRSDLQFVTNQSPLGPPKYGKITLRNLSADGNRVFFDSIDKLVASDINGVGDVYEWEAKGTGSCATEDVNGGCIYLISSGTSPKPSYFADASASGDHAFFFTRDALVAGDQDQLVDVYDAAVDGGLVSQQSAPPSDCADNCQGDRPVPPSDAGAGTSAFNGTGNLPGRKPVSSGRVSVSKKAVRGSSFLLAVKVPAAGTVRATGASIRSVSRSAAKAESLGLRVRLSAKAKSTLKKKKRLLVKLKVSFKPTSGPMSTVSVSLTVKA